MALEDIRDGLREQVKSVWGRVRESDAFLQLNEKYQGLSPIGQKLSLVGVSLLAFLLVMAIPWSFYSGSQVSVEDYEGKRNVIRELFRVNREAAALMPAPPPVSSSDLQNVARGTLTTAHLQADQIVEVVESTSSLASVPKTIDQTGVQVSLAKLNLKQIVDIGHSLQNMQGTARMTGLEIKANVSDARYYDVIYKVVAFAAKPEPTTNSKGRKK